MTQQGENRNLFDVWGQVLDPFGVWQAAHGNGAETYVKQLSEFVTAYTEATGKVVDAYGMMLQPFQRLFETTTTRGLSSLNLATRADIEALHERLAAIEQRLDNRSTPLDALKQALRKRDG